MERSFPINEKIAALLNEQINKEFYSAYLYLDIANYYDDLDLNGYNMALLDLNGKNVTLADNVSEGEGAVAGKLTVMDSTTADYDVADGVYGKITNIGNQVTAADGYMPVSEGDSTSFHKFVMEMTELVVNPIKVGISYKADFKGDQIIKAAINEFGVAVRAYYAPDENSILLDTAGLTHMALKQSAWQTGDSDNTVKSVYVKEIMDPNVSAAMNDARAQVPIYTLAYVRLQDGTMLFSDAFAFSLKTAMKQMNDYWNDLDDAGKDTLAKFYLDYAQVMQNWPDIGNISQRASQIEIA